MAYTPELSIERSASLRRLAWFISKPMTETLAMVIDEHVKSIDSTQICEACKDKTKCNSCLFNNKDK